MAIFGFGWGSFVSMKTMVQLGDVAMPSLLCEMFEAPVALQVAQLYVGFSAAGLNTGTVLCNALRMHRGAADCLSVS